MFEGTCHSSPPFAAMRMLSALHLCHLRASRRCAPTDLPWAGSLALAPFREKMKPNGKRKAAPKRTPKSAGEDITSAARSAYDKCIDAAKECWCDLGAAAV